MSRQTSMGYTTGMLIWISVAWPISPSGIFWPSFSRDDAFLMFTRSGFFPRRGPPWTLGLDHYGNRATTTAMEKFSHFGVTAAGFTLRVSCFPGIRSSGTYSTILRFLYGGGVLMVYD